MRRTSRGWAVAAALAASTALAVTPAVTAAAGTTSGPTKADAKAAAAETAKDRNIPVPAPPDVTAGKLPLEKVPGGAQLRAQAAAPAAAPAVGDVRYWLALDDENGYYLKKFKLLGDGQHIQIWVAVDDSGNQALTFPAGSSGACRNEVFDGGEVTVTQPQIDSFIHEFDTNMFPKESEAFSALTSPGRVQRRPVGLLRRERQHRPPASRQLRGSRRQGRHPRRQRPGRQLLRPRHAGRPDLHRRLLLAAYAAVLDRNIMTIDSFDWLHRTGADSRPTTGRTPTGCTYAGVTPRPHSLRGHLRPRVPAPAGERPGPGRGQLGQRGPLRLGADPRRLRRPEHTCRPRTRPTATSAASRATCGDDVRRPGELPHPLERPGSARRSSATTARPTR